MASRARPKQRRSERQGCLPDHRTQPDRHTERMRRELALHDQRRQRDDIPDRKTEHHAADVERLRSVRHRQHQRQSRGLRCEAGSRCDALIDPVDHRSECEPPGCRRDRGGGDGNSGAVAAKVGQQERDLVHDEADLRRQRQGKRQRDAPEMQTSQHLPRRDACPVPAAACSRTATRPTPNITIGSRIASVAGTSSSTACSSPMRCTNATSNGVMVKPPALAPFSARLSARPRLRSNQYASVMAIAVMVVAGPADRHHDAADIELPRRLRAAQADHAEPENDRARCEQQTRAKQLDGTVHAREQHRAGEVIDRGRRGDQRGRPAACLVQVGEVDRLAVEAEAPGEDGSAEAGQHNGPAAAKFARWSFGGCGDNDLAHVPQAGMRRAMPQTIPDGGFG